MESVKLHVRYASLEDFIAEHDSQIVKGGLLVRGAAPAKLALFDRVDLEISGGFSPLDATAIVVTGQVVQIIAGVGVAVAFDPAPLAAAVAAARAGRQAPVAPVAAVAAAALVATEASKPGLRPAASPGIDTASKINQALHGNKDDRMRIIRDLNKMLHGYVLRNPGLGLDEVLAMAKNSTLAPDLLGNIADRREWAQRPDIAIALVRNPKTPVAAAIRLLEFVSAGDLRQLAKDTHTRPAVQQAARKKVIGGA
jgi:hypothetical protein